MQTLHDKFSAGLTALGAIKLPNHFGHTVFQYVRPDDQKIRFYFVGSAGSLRIADSKAFTKSHPCSQIHKDLILSFAPAPPAPKNAPLARQAQDISLEDLGL